MPSTATQSIPTGVRNLGAGIATSVAGTRSKGARQPKECAVEARRAVAVANVGRGDLDADGMRRAITVRIEVKKEQRRLTAAASAARLSPRRPAR